MQTQYCLLFPGQGSQYVGMDKIPRSYLGDAQVDEIWQQVNDTLGFDLAKLVKEGPLPELTLTQNAQPALVATSYLFLRMLEKFWGNEWRKKIQIVIGHSLGEYSALLAAGALTLHDAVHITHLRGKWMQEAVPVGVGSMHAILRSNKQLIQTACESVSQKDQIVSIANDNAPEQVVISGHSAACLKAIEWLEKNSTDKFRSLPLPVSAPFHCALMQPAAERLKQELLCLNWQSNQIVYISNIDAAQNPVGSSSKNMLEKLYFQVCGTVLWVDSFKSLPEGLKCLEVGPGSVLAGLGKKISPNQSTLFLDQPNSLDLLKSV